MNNMLGHADYGGGFDCVEQRAVGEKTAKQVEADADSGSKITVAGPDGRTRLIDQNTATETEDAYQDAGFGLGLPGLASLTLPSETMVVPPLNFSMVGI